MTDDPTARTPGPGFKNPQWCMRHWAPLRDGSMAGTHNALAGSLDTLQRFIERGTTEGWLKAHWTSDKQNAALDAHSPICCYLGDAEMQSVYDNARRDHPRPPMTLPEAPDAFTH